MVEKTQTGLFLRLDTSGEVFVYSPYTGLFFSCMAQAQDRQRLVEWLRGDSSSAPSERYAESIGAGWFVPLSRARYPRKHSFGAMKEREATWWPDHPLLINWFITGYCTYRCVYCYAQDLMEASRREPTASEIRQIAKRILAHNPLSVVLTGGDPLCSRHITAAIQSLHNKTAIIVDTNGSLLSREHIALFKEYRVFVRVSIDSERPQVNQRLRSPKDDGECTLTTALRCVDLCVRADVPVAIQTVITNRNLSDIESLLPKLMRLGIRGWRLLYLARHSRFPTYKAYEPNGKRFYANIRDSLCVTNTRGWDENMWVQVVDSYEPKGVILVSPGGEFFTEEEGGKVYLDRASPSQPSLDSLRRSINWHAHLDRYLGMDETPHTYVGK